MGRYIRLHGRRRRCPEDTLRQAAMCARLDLNALGPPLTPAEHDALRAGGLSADEITALRVVRTLFRAGRVPAAEPSPAPPEDGARCE